MAAPLKHGKMVACLEQSCTVSPSISITFCDGPRASETQTRDRCEAAMRTSNELLNCSWLVEHTVSFLNVIRSNTVKINFWSRNLWIYGSNGFTFRISMANTQTSGTKRSVPHNPHYCSSFRTHTPPPLLHKADQRLLIVLAALFGGKQWLVVFTEEWRKSRRRGYHPPWMSEIVHHCMQHGF